MIPNHTDWESEDYRKVFHDFSSVHTDNASMTHLIENNARGLYHCATGAMIQLMQFNTNTVHLTTIILTFIRLMAEAFGFLGFTGQLLIFRLTARGLRRPRHDTTLSSSISSSTAS